MIYAEHFRIEFVPAKNVKIKDWPEEKKQGTAAQIICRHCGEDAYSTEGYVVEKGGKSAKIQALQRIVDDGKTWIGLEIHLMMCSRYEDSLHK